MKPENGGLGQSEMASHCQPHPSSTWFGLPKGRCGEVEHCRQGKVILRTPCPGPCSQAMMPLEVDKPAGGLEPGGSAQQGGGYWAQGHLFLPLAQSSYWSPGPGRLPQEGSWQQKPIIQGFKKS